MKTTTGIYTIIEKIYSDNTTNVFNYSSYEKAIENYNNLKNYYLKEYDQYIKDNSYISDDHDNPCMDIYDICYIELYYNDIDKNIDL